MPQYGATPACVLTFITVCAAFDDHFQMNCTRRRLNLSDVMAPSCQWLVYYINRFWTEVRLINRMLILNIYLLESVKASTLSINVLHVQLHRATSSIPQGVNRFISWHAWQFVQFIVGFCSFLTQIVRRNVCLRYKSFLFLSGQHITVDYWCKGCIKADVLLHLRTQGLVI